MTRALDAHSRSLEELAETTPGGQLLPERLAQLESVEVGGTPSEVVYEENELELDGEPVDPAAIDMPVLQVVGEHDDLVPPEASLPFNDAVGSDETDVIEFPTGHIGVSVSSRSHDEYWPRVAEWFAEKS